MIDICGRKVKIQTGAKSQTVNICNRANICGQYDYIVRLRPPFITADALLNQRFNSIPDLVQYLERHHAGEIERTPQTPRTAVPEIGSKTEEAAALSGLHPLIELFRSAEVNSFGSFGVAASVLSEDELASRFERERKAAPYRGLHRSYFVGHTGRTTSGAPTNRREEQLAIALWLAYQASGFALPDGSFLFPIDYQLPLKSHRDQANAGLGKIDLFCADSGGEPWICELKVHSVRDGRVETPLKGLLEALAYCATLDADMRLLSRESDDKKRMLLHVVSPERPNLMVLAPAEYWKCCNVAGTPYSWAEPLQAVSRRIEEALKLRVRFVRMDNCRWEMTSSGEPRLVDLPSFNWAFTST